MQKKNRADFSKRIKVSSGFTTLEMIICLGVLVQLLILFASYTQRNTDALLDRMAAEQLSMVHQASRYYVQDHFKEILETLQADENESFEISMSELKEKQYLPKEQSEKNVYQQSYSASVFLQQNSDEEGSNQKSILKLLVYTKQGANLKEPNLRNIANYLGGCGGYISKSTPETIIGSFHAWQLSIPSNLSLGQGHNIAISYLSQGKTVSADCYLRRFPSEDNPDLNVMHADLKIASNFSLEFEEWPICKLNQYGLSIRNKNGDEITIGPEKIEIVKNQGDQLKKETVTLTAHELEFISNLESTDVKKHTALSSSIFQMYRKDAYNNVYERFNIDFRENKAIPSLCFLSNEREYAKLNREILRMEVKNPEADLNNPNGVFSGINLYTQVDGMNLRSRFLANGWIMWVEAMPTISAEPYRFTIRGERDSDKKIVLDGGSILIRNRQNANLAVFNNDGSLKKTTLDIEGVHYLTVTDV